MIYCKALNENSLYMTSGGHIIPCGFIYTNGPFNMPNELLEFSEEENFESLVETWDTNKPYSRCFMHCDDCNSNKPYGMAQFEKQIIMKKDNK